MWLHRDRGMWLQASELLLQQKNVLLAESDFRFEQLQQEVEQNYTVIEQLRRELNALSNRAGDEQVSSGGTTCHLIDCLLVVVVRDGVLTDATGTPS